MSSRWLPLVGLIVCHVAACLPRARGPHGLADAPPPTTFERFTGAIEWRDEVCQKHRDQMRPGSVACETYELRFPEDARVRIELRASARPIKLTVDVHTAIAEPGVPAIIELEAGYHPYAIGVAGTDTGVYSDYELVVGPRPIETLRVPPAKMPWPARRAEILAKPLQTGMDQPEARAKAAMRDAVRDYTARAPAIEARLEAFAPIEIPVAAGYCYRVAYGLGKGAAYGELTTRQLDAVVRIPDVDQPLGSEFHGRQGVSERFCAEHPGVVRFALSLRGVPVDHVGELGTGPVAITVHEQASWPGLMSEAQLRAQVARATAGHRPLTSYRFDLAAPAPKPIAMARGKCYAAVARLEKGAAWSPLATRMGTSMSADGPDEGYAGGPMVGPGIAGAFGCISHSGRYDLVIKPPSPETVLGSGHLSVQVYVRNARPGELEADERASRAGIQESNRHASERLRTHCARCRERSGSKDELETCARTGGYDSNACY